MSLRQDQIALRVAKRNAGFFLLCTAIIFVTAHFLPVSQFWRKMIQTAGEAGTVGGLADWFAVTALFRRPMGMPIPHTALIPSRKNEIGKSIAGFVEEYFLNEQSLIATLRAKDRARQLGLWLSSYETSKLLATSIAQNLQTLAARGVHLDLVDLILPALKSIRKNLHGDLEKAIAKMTGWFVPTMFDKMVSGRVADELDRFLEQLGTPGSEERNSLDNWINQQLIHMPASWNKPLARIAQELKTLEATSGQKLGLVIGDGGVPPSLVAAISELIANAGRALLDSPEKRKFINKTLERGVTEYLVPFGSQIGDYISGVVTSWDARTITEALELKVGKDLQFVRINGTIIGALAGVVLFLVGWLFGIS